MFRQSAAGDSFASHSGQLRQCERRSRDRQRFQNVRGDGVFYVNSHGGPGFDANQQAFYAVWTVDPIDVATLGNYRAMVANHELVGMLETSNDALGNCKKIMHYGFTSKFVRRYMSFPKNSLVIVDACNSSSAPAADLRQAFADKGASVYVGWSQVVDANFAYKAMKYLLDRLMGLNKISPESPEQRAFNIDDVLEDMATNRHLVTDPYMNAVLTVSKLKDDFGLLAPSILFLSIESFAGVDQLYIAGMFGTDPGPGKRTVKINDASLPVDVWEPTLIQCPLTDDLAGTVVVEVGEGAKPRVSNSVNLTKWEAELIYEHDDPGSMSAEVRLKVNFRADIHSFREKPHETPFETTVLFNPMHDASISITTSGSYSETSGSCTDTYTFLHGLEMGSPFVTQPEVAGPISDPSTRKHGYFDSPSTWSPSSTPAPGNTPVRPNAHRLRRPSIPPSASKTAFSTTSWESPRFACRWDRDSRSPGTIADPATLTRWCRT